jgi:hypothetical protein
MKMAGTNNTWKLDWLCAFACLVVHALPAFATSPPIPLTAADFQTVVGNARLHAASPTTTYDGQGNRVKVGSSSSLGVKSRQTTKWLTLWRDFESLGAWQDLCEFS